MLLLLLYFNYYYCYFVLLFFLQSFIIIAKRTLFVLQLQDYLFISLKRTPLNLLPLLRVIPSHDKAQLDSNWICESSSSSYTTTFTKPHASDNQIAFSPSTLSLIIMSLSLCHAPFTSTRRRTNTLNVESGRFTHEFISGLAGRRAPVLIWLSAHIHGKQQPDSRHKRISQSRKGRTEPANLSRPNVLVDDMATEEDCI